MASVLVAVDSYHVLPYDKRLIDVTWMVLHSQEQESPIILYNKFLLITIDDVYAYLGQITKVTPKNRSLQGET